MSTHAPGASDDRWLLVDVAAARSGVSRRTVYNWITAGKVEWKRAPFGRSRLVRLSDVQFQARARTGRTVRSATFPAAAR